MIPFEGRIEFILVLWAQWGPLHGFKAIQKNGWRAEFQTIGHGAVPAVQEDHGISFLNEMLHRSGTSCTVRDEVHDVSSWFLNGSNWACRCHEDYTARLVRLVMVDEVSHQLFVQLEAFGSLMLFKEVVHFDCNLKLYHSIALQQMQVVCLLYIGFGSQFTAWRPPVP